jgi:hypothetical protein
MEPGVVEFLKRVGMSIGIALLWLGINAIAAIKGDNAFIEGPVRLGNILFYLWFIISIVALVIIIKKLWNKDFKNNEEVEEDQ